jgi:O-antigen/teichoic acid export membrane protein
VQDIRQQRENRGAKARRTGIWGVIYQGVYAVVQLVCLGMLVRYIDNQQYGLWLTVIAASAWMTLANLGQTSALLTKLGAVALTDHQAALRVFSASTFLVTSISTILVACLAVVGAYVPWAQLFNAEANMTDYSVGSVAMAGMLISLLALPAGLGAASIFAHQRGDLVHKIMVCGSLFCLAATGMAVWYRMPMWIVGWISLSGPILGGIALWFIGITNALVPRPNFLSVDSKMLREMVFAGSIFFLLDASGLWLLRMPDLIVAHTNGIAAVGPFASVGRLPLLMIALFQAVLLPFWPALSEAAHRGDFGWIKKMISQTLLMVLGLWFLGATGIWFLGARFIQLWTGSSDFSSTSLIAAASIQSLGLGLFAWLSVLLSGLSQQRTLLIISGLASLTLLPAALFLGNEFGPVGVAMAQAAVMLFCVVPLGSYALYRTVVVNK